MKNWTMNLLTVLWVLLLVSGCARKKPNVLIITMDTTRADRLGCYGYEKAFTPNLDSLAAEGVLFENAQAVMPITLPTHTTIFTGYLPIEHGLRLNRECKLNEGVTTMAECFKAEGYKTAAFVAAGILNAKFGLNQGFDLYSEKKYKEGGGASPRMAEEMSTLAVNWLTDVLAEKKRSPFMMWVHYYDPHMPRRSHPELRGLKNNDLYDGELAYMDYHIGRIFEFLRKQGLMDDTLIIALADHGENLGEHNELFHGYFLYQGTQHIPLLVRWPGKLPAGLRLKGTVSQTDIFPTVLDLTKVKLLDCAENVAKPAFCRSFAEALKGKEELGQRLCHMEALWTYQRFGWAPLAGLVEGQWSYIRAPESELYDLQADPGQVHNLADSNARKLDEMSIELESIEDSVEGQKVSNVSITEEEIRRFASLGYVSGRADTIADLKKEKDFLSLPDPKTKSHVISAYNRTSHEVRGINSDYISDEILDDALILVEEFPDKPRYLIQAGKVYLIRKNQQKALEMFSRAEKISPTNSVVLKNLGDIYGQRNEIDKMVEYYQRVVEQRPHDKRIQCKYDAVLAQALNTCINEGRKDKAATLYNTLKNRNPDAPGIQALLKQYNTISQ